MTPPSILSHSHPTTFFWGVCVCLEIVAFGQNVEYQSIAVREDSDNPVVPVYRAATMKSVSTTTNPRSPRWTMGHLKLPPGAVMSMQFSGLVTQTFTVVTGHDLEYAIGAQKKDESSSSSTFASQATRFQLRAGDTFCVPPGNYFGLRNLSSTTPCLLTWTLIYPYHHHVSGETRGDDDTGTTGSAGADKLLDTNFVLETQDPHVAQYLVGAGALDNETAKDAHGTADGGGGT